MMGVLQRTFGQGEALADRGFSEFLDSRRGNIRSLAARTRGEMTADDLASEAWLIALEIEQRRGWRFDFADMEDQETLLAWMHNRFVKYAEKAVRYAMRLDRDWDQEDGEQAGAALARLLTAPLDADPQLRMQTAEEGRDLASVVRQSYSEAAAYVLLLIRVDWHMQDLADMLAIGRCALRARLRAAGLHALVQPSLFDGVDFIDPNFEPTRRIRWPRFRFDWQGMWAQAFLWHAPA
jgi:hypothetical protein